MASRRSTLAAAAALSFPTAALAAAPPVPAFDTVCVKDAAGRDVVDKEKLATFYLDQKPVSRTLEDWARDHNDSAFGASQVPVASWKISPRQRMLVDGTICKDPTGAGNTACASDDEANLVEARGSLTLLLTAFGSSFPKEGAADTPLEYFQRTDVQLLCNRAVERPPGSLPVPTYKYTFPIRLRGSTEGLNFDREEPDFAIVEAASVTLSRDDVADKKVKKWSVVAGLALPPVIDETYRSLSFVPYLGALRDFSHVTGKDPSNTFESTYGGVLADFRFTRPGPTPDDLAVTHYITLRPEYRESDSDSDTSHLWTLTAAWMPIRNDGINSFREFRPGATTASWRLIADVRAVGGWFTDRGNLLPPYNQDFIRVGTRVGFAITSDLPNFPVDLIVTDTWLPNLSSGKDLNFFTSRLSFSPDPKKIFTFELSYSKGRRSDVLIDQQEWKLSLGAKY
ncbi:MULTISPECIES: hypothetical protein [unclassified Phenylobacterium]|uniref:hypothetical protein n=1 Tax=unclassified Phenylobacterium TaxID=2640670 RepID=UPI000839E255|nr:MULTISPECIES: hypothetical protein [unclassified Phenylobacterium]